MLRDIRDVAVGTLSTRITSQLQSLQGLHLRLQDIGKYLQKVLDGELPVNHAILGNLQDVFNLLPNLSTPKTSPIVDGVNHGVPAAENSELARAMSVKTNDQLMSIYLSSLIRAITAFHDLIENKIQNKQQAEDRDASVADDAAIASALQDDEAILDVYQEPGGADIWRRPPTADRPPSSDHLTGVRSPAPGPDDAAPSRPRSLSWPQPLRSSSRSAQLRGSGSVVLAPRGSASVVSPPNGASRSRWTAAPLRNSTLSERSCPKSFTARAAWLARR